MEGGAESMYSPMRLIWILKEYVNQMMGILKPEERGRDNHHQWLWTQTEPSDCIAETHLGGPCHWGLFLVTVCLLLQANFSQHIPARKCVGITTDLYHKHDRNVIDFSNRMLIITWNFSSNVICPTLPTISQRINYQGCWVPGWKGRAVPLRSWRASWLSQLSWMRPASVTAGKTLQWGQRESHLKRGPTRQWF